MIVSASRLPLMRQGMCPTPARIEPILELAMSERNAVHRAFDGFGRDAGMEKKSGSWYRRTPEIISVSNLQKSEYGPHYYFNQAFWLRCIGDDLYPKEWKCHLRDRLGQLLPHREEQVKALFDLNVAMSDEDRIAQIRQILDGELLPIIEAASTVVGLRNLWKAGPLQRTPFVTRAAREEFSRVPD